MSQTALQLPPVERRRDGNAEARRQAGIVSYIHWCAPQVVVFHVPNGGLRSKAEAARLKWTGVLAGVLDLVLVLPEGRVAFWEVKTPPGRISPAQFAFIDRLEASGHAWAVVRGIDDARIELARLGIGTRELSVTTVPSVTKVSANGRSQAQMSEDAKRAWRSRKAKAAQ